MRSYLTSLVHLFILHSGAQITMQINLPRAISANSETSFEVKIRKGNIRNFSKYELSTGAGIEIMESENQGGSFSFADQVAKVIWPITPESQEIHVKFMIRTIARGTYTINQKFYYLEGTDKREAEVQPYIISVVDSVPGIASSGFTTLKPFVPPNIPLGSMEAEGLDPNNPEEVNQHVMQLNRDSKEASRVGELELHKANVNLEDALTILRQAEHLEEGETKQKVIEQANKAKDRAELDIQIANKILALAKSLESNASDISRHQAGQPSKQNKSDEMATDKESAERIRTDAAETLANLPAEKFVYRIQLGAFAQQPNKNDFKKFGKVEIVKENGFYKVLVDQFINREDAVKKRDLIISRELDAFIVRYQNGARVQ